MNRGKQKSSGMRLAVQLVVDFPQYVRCAFPEPFYNKLLSFRAYTVGRQYIWWNLLRAFLRQSLPWRLHPWQILTEEFTKQQAREAGGRWGLGRNDALGKNSAEEPNFQEIPMAAFLLHTSGGLKSGSKVLLLREASSASRKVRLRSTKQKSHAQCHQLWELQKTCRMV